MNKKVTDAEKRVDAVGKEVDELKKGIECLAGGANALQEERDNAGEALGRSRRKKNVPSKFRQSNGDAESEEGATEEVQCQEKKEAIDRKESAWLLLRVWLVCFRLR